MQHFSKVISIIFLLCICHSVFGQEHKKKELQALEKNPTYYKGKGVQSNYSEARQEAGANLIRSISMTITDRESTDVSTINGHVNEVINSTFQITSSITNLKNVQYIDFAEKTGKNQYQYTVLAYVNAKEIDQMLQEQEAMILDFIKQAQAKQFDKEIGFALMDYYQAFVLLNTSPLGYSMNYTNYNGDVYKAHTYLTHQIEDILQDITVESLQVNPTDKSVTLGFKYKDELISGPVLFDYYDASIYANCENRQANNGCYILKFNSIPEVIDISIAYHDTCNIANRMVKDAMKINGKVKFFNAQKVVAVSNKSVQKRETRKQTNARFEVQSTQEKIYKEHTAKLSDKDKEALKAILLHIENTITTKQYDAIRSYFTPNGYERWQALVKRGKAKLIGRPNYSFLKLDTTIYCRGMKLQFEFQDNFRPIVEDVCFRFNLDNKIHSLSFCLSNGAEHDIMSDRKQWSDTAKITLLSFLEDYKTAYALKDTTYLEKVFSNDALIIVGRVLKKTPRKGNDDIYRLRYSKHPEDSVDYKVKSKKEFIADLKRNLRQKQWVNIMFEDVDVKRRIRDDSDLYGIQVKQNYFSNSYCDEGYLSLLVDLKNELPVIYVRVWQIDKVEDFSAETIANNPGIALMLGELE